MDILLFREKSAQESLEFAKDKEWKFYSSLKRYAASFCTDPEWGFQFLSGQSEFIGLDIKGIENE